MVNYYVFYSSGNPEQDTKTPQTFRAAVDSLSEAWDRWRDNILPEILEEIEYYRHPDFDNLNNQRLNVEINRLIKLRLRSGRLHEETAVPYFQSMNLFLNAYTRLTDRD
jgi:hypothetical protein